MAPKALTSDDIKHEMKLEKLYYVIKHRDPCVDECLFNFTNQHHSREATPCDMEMRH